MMMDGKRSGEITNTENKKRKYGVNLRTSLTDNVIKDRVLRAWAQSQRISLTQDLDVEVMADPFKCCVVKGFIEESCFLEKLKEELYPLNLIIKNNDLYQFRQSVDLANVECPAINDLKRFLVGPCRTWLQEVTGITLNEKLSVTFSCYNDTDYLLCHDDKCEDRRIAFILYLNKEWCKDDGGALNLFSTNEKGDPEEVIQSICPEYNCFVFFEVTNHSFHQVAEVLTCDKSRVTINGWFHSEVHCSPILFKEPLQDKVFPHIEASQDILNNYVNPQYLKREYQREISATFEEENEMALEDFFTEDLYSHLCKSFGSSNICWRRKGPANCRCYYTAEHNSLPSDVKSVVDLMTSSSIFTFLQKLTNLDLTSGEEGVASSSRAHKSTGQPHCSYEIQKWEPGCYTLVNDNDARFEKSALDATIFFCVDNVKEHKGGFVSYIARDEDEELLTVVPTRNTLALTYRDNETLCFVKYINHHFKGCFYSVSLIYYE